MTAKILNLAKRRAFAPNPKPTNDSPAQCALKRAIRELRPHANIRCIAECLVKLQSADDTLRSTNKPV
jgi:hypothetical protein